MYYIAVSNMGRVNIGERVILTKDKLFDEISAIKENGEVVGYVASFSIEGCLSKDFLNGIIEGGREIICDIAIKSGDVMILSAVGASEVPSYQPNRQTASYYHS